MNYFYLTAMEYREDGSYVTVSEGLYQTLQPFEDLFKQLTTLDNGMVIEGRIVSYFAVRSFADFEVKINIGTASGLESAFEPSSKSLESLNEEFLAIPDFDHFVVVESPLSSEQINEVEGFISKSKAGEFAIVDDKYSFEHGASAEVIAYVISLGANFTVELARWIVQKFFDGDSSQVKAFSLPSEARKYISEHAHIPKRGLVLVRQHAVKGDITAFTFSTATDLYRIEMDARGQVSSFNSRKRRAVT